MYYVTMIDNYDLFDKCPPFPSLTQTCEAFQPQTSHYRLWLLGYVTTATVMTSYGFTWSVSCIIVS